MDDVYEAGSMTIAEEVFADGGEMGALMRALDWAQTPPGPVETWPQSLRTAISICLASYFPMLIWWGPELVMFYNDAYRPILGAKHPKSMGQRGRECWPEIWDIIGPMLEGVLTQGKATWSENQLLLLDRNGYVEECYFTFSYSPIRDESGGVGGVFTAVTETTQQVLGERRLRTLRELAANTFEAKTAGEACRIAAEVLANNTDDLPFALLYLLDAQGKQVTLAGASGIASDTAVYPRAVEITQEPGAGQDISTLLSQVVQTQEPLAVKHAADYFGAMTIHTPLQASIQTAMALPLVRAGQQEPYGLLVVGASPIRALDDDYRGFYTLVAGQIATAIASARAYQEARAQAEALAELDRAKTVFFSNISHEFRTPLTLMLGPIEDALSRPQQELTQEQRGWLEMVHRNALRLLKLVNALLDFSRVESGRLQAAYEPTDLARLTRDLASAFHSTIEKAGLRYCVDCEDLPEPVYVDHEMWEKIVLNLLSNAFKFTFSGEIGVRLRAIDDHVELQISDTGTGIPAEELPRIFERFHRVRDAHARTYEGSGIGLSLVQELVRLHGGSVQVASRPGEGTTFTVSLPFGKAHLPAERIRATGNLRSTGSDIVAYVEEAMRWLPEETAAGTPPGLAEASHTPEPERVDNIVESDGGAQTALSDYILLADDNADMRDYLIRLLRTYWKVKGVTNGEEALAQALADPPALILSDIMMPGLDGFQLLHALRSDARTNAVPVILLSARAGEEAAIEGLQAGAIDYLTKPFSSKELIARIHTRLELSRIRREMDASAQEKARLYKQARDAIRIRDELFSIVSHDLKNPVATIKGFAQLLRRTINRADFPDKEQIVDGLARIDNTATRMTILINELLDIARLQIGRPLDLNLRETELVMLVHQVVNAHQQTTQKHSLTITVDIPEVRGMWDAIRLERVLGNLLTNAIKYSPEGGTIAVSIGHEGDAENGYALLSVQDEGIGIPGEDLPHIFDQFHRAKNVSEQIIGTGLGLASARKIIEQHGGSISVTSQEGGGSTFTIRLPQNPPEEANGE